MVTLTEKTNKQTNKCKKVCKQQQEGTENNDVHVSDLQMSNLHKALELDSTTGNRDLKIRRRRPQRERHKSNRFNPLSPKSDQHQISPRNINAL